MADDALFAAVENGDVGTVERALRAGVSANAVNGTDWSLLSLAAWVRRSPAVAIAPTTQLAAERADGRGETADRARSRGCAHKS